MMMKPGAEALLEVEWLWLGAREEPRVVAVWERAATESAVRVVARRVG